ncbi:MAG TPA: hypothetical protein VNW92_00455 [Polyangiaceae bacterium]|nr:hypothetical protein [Polyangiaceae bacterium]
MSAPAERRDQSATGQKRPSLRPKRLLQPWRSRFGRSDYNSWATALVGAISVFAASTLLARQSAAQEQPEPIAWTYRAPPECPPAETFEREFRARTTRAELVTDVADADADAARSFLVTLSSEPGRAVGRIEIRGPADAVSTRQVAGQTCGGVVSALALVAALAVDPLAADSPPAPSPPSAPTPHVAPKPVPVASPGEAGRAERTSTHAVVAAGLDGSALIGLFPKPAASVALFSEVRLERGSVLAPSARLSLSGAVSASTAAPPGSAKFRWLAAALDGCPFDFRLLQVLHVTPCAFMEVGVLEGSGAGVAVPETESRRWLALGGSGRLSWSIFRSFFVEAQGRLEAPLARDTFVLTVPERVVIHTVPAVLGSFGLGVGLRWP